MQTDLSKYAEMDLVERECSLDMPSLTGEEGRWILGFSGSKERKGLPTVVMYPVDMTGCGNLRIYLPGREIHRRGLANVFYTNSISTDTINRADLCVFQRVTTPRQLEGLRYAKSLGKAIVMDTDDNFRRIRIEVRKYHQFNHGVDMSKTFDMAVIAANVLTVSTPELERTYRNIKRNIYVSFNRLEYFGYPRKPFPTKRPIIGYAGSGASMEDWKTCAEAVSHILRKRPEVRMVVAGYDYRPCFPEDIRNRIELRPWAPFQYYHSVMADFDIAIAPVPDTHFNRSKSHIKLLDYAVAGTPSVVSRVAPYSRYFELGHEKMGTDVCRLSTTSDEWEENIENLLDSIVLREEIGMASGLFARQQYNITDAPDELWPAWKAALES